MGVTKNFRQMLKSKDITDLIDGFKQTYNNKYYDAFCSQFEIEGFDYRYLKTFRSKLYSKGSVWVRKNKITDEPVCCDYAPASYDNNNLPVTVQLVTYHNPPQSVIPTKKLQVVDKDGVIVWIRACEKGYKGDVDYYIGKLAEAETLITVNLYLQRCPWILTSDSANYSKLKNLLQNIFSDEPAIITDIDKDDLDNIELNTPWIVDKLTQYQERLENKLKTLLGLDNQGGFINNQQQNLDTTNSNNGEIIGCQEMLYKTLEDGVKRANDVCGLNLRIIKKSITPEQESISHSAGEHDYPERGEKDEH